jgi:hypothetical protein
VRWVEQRSYVGPDRRRESKFRLFDRRRKDESVPLPAIQVLLRQLHLRVLDLATAREALAQFHLRVRVASQVTQTHGELESARLLSDVERRIEARHGVQGGVSPNEADEIQGLVTDALCALQNAG